MVRSSLPPHLQLHVVAPDPLEKNQEGDLPIETLVQKVPDHVGGHRRQESQGEIVANVAALDREGCRVTGPAYAEPPTDDGRIAPKGKIIGISSSRRAAKEPTGTVAERPPPASTRAR